MGINIKNLGPALLLLTGAFTATAQKLPTVQQVSLRAPADIKIDGKSLEWHNGYQADNTSCRICYTVCNDDENLYLVIRDKDLSGNSKILKGGITLTIDAAVKGEKSKPVLITYPAVPSKTDVRYEILRNNVIAYYKRPASDSLKRKRELDSLITVANSVFVDLFKDIQLSGIADIIDPIFSVYNTYGFKAVARFDNKMLYTYELAIPLKYLGAAVNAGGKFRYNIRLNSLATIKVPGTFAPPVIIVNPGSNIDPDTMYVNNPTDFWGYYTLARK